MSNAERAAQLRAELFRAVRGNEELSALVNAALAATLAQGWSAGWETLQTEVRDDSDAKV